MPTVVAPIPRFGTFRIRLTARSSAAVIDGLEIAEQIFDLFTRVEVDPSYDLVWDICQQTLLFKQTGLGIGSVEDRTLSVICQMFSPVCFAISPTTYSASSNPFINWRKWSFSPSGFSVQRRLLLTCCIVGDHLIRRIQDILGGTVVLLQADHLRIRENPLKSKDVANVGSAEFVDGLVIITYYA